MSKSPTLFSSDEDDEGPHNEVLLLKKFQTMLHGVPPPSSVTLSKLSCCDMLEKYKENCDSFGFSNGKLQNCSKKNNTTPLVYYLNTSKTSEEIANLSQKIISRFVYSETMSSCNVWFDSYISDSEKKLQVKRNRIGFSPGSRLSHLARRRTVFCSENLQKLANSEKRRHIEIEKQKSCKSKNSSSSNLAELDKHISFKRALFLSPDEDEANKLKVLNSSSQQNLFTVASNKMLQDGSRKSIWLSQQNSIIGSSRKRKRTESRESSGNWPRRALTFTEDDLNRSQDFNSKKTKIISEIQLSLHHKSKLLWAVSVSLKEKNMQSNDPQFKTCASSLFMICRKNISKILSSKIEGGTSDKMLHFARQHVDEIFKKLNISREKKVNNKTSQRLDSLDSKLDSYKNSSEEDKESLNDSDKQLFANKNSSCESKGPSESNASSTADDNSRLNEKENFEAGIIL